MEFSNEFKQFIRFDITTPSEMKIDPDEEYLQNVINIITNKLNKHNIWLNMNQQKFRQFVRNFYYYHYDKDVHRMSTYIIYELLIITNKINSNTDISSILNKYNFDSKIMTDLSEMKFAGIQFPSFIILKFVLLHPECRSVYQNPPKTMTTKKIKEFIVTAITKTFDLENTPKEQDRKILDELTKLFLNFVIKITKQSNDCITSHVRNFKMVKQFHNKFEISSEFVQNYIMSKMNQPCYGYMYDSLPRNIVEAYMQSIATSGTSGGGTADRKIHTGKKGGKYVIRNGKKVYIKRKPVAT